MGTSAIITSATVTPPATVDAPPAGAPEQAPVQQAPEQKSDSEAKPADGPVEQAAAGSSVLGTTSTPPAGEEQAKEGAQPVDPPSPTQGPVQQGPVQQEPTQSPVQQAPVEAPDPKQSPVQSPDPKQSPVEQVPTQLPPSIVGGGGRSRPRVFLANHDRASSVTLYSSQGTSIRFWGDPHVTTVINGRTRQFDIGYGPGRVRLSDGTVIRWNTTSRTHAMLHFSIDAPGKDNDLRVSTRDHRNEHRRPTSLSESQLREFIARIWQLRGSTREPLRRA